MKETLEGRGKKEYVYILVKSEWLNSSNLLV